MRDCTPRGADLILNRLTRPVAKLQALWPCPHSWIALDQHARIVLDEFEVTLHSPDQIAPVGVLHPTKFHLEAKDSSAKLSPGLLSSVYEVADDMPEKEEMVMKGEEVSVIELKNIRSSVEVLTTIISQQHGIFTICCWLSNSQKLGEHV